MAIQTSKFCKECGKKTLHEKQAMSGGMGCLLTILTGGLFLIFWIFQSAFILPFRPFRCQQCGKGRRL